MHGHLNVRCYCLYILLHVQWKTPDDGQRNCPKHVEFYFKNKSEKLVHLVGFIIRIHHDARSPERRMLLSVCIAVCTVKNCWWWTEEMSETCRVLFQNKFEKLVHLVGFIIRIHHDARSPERQMLLSVYIAVCTVKNSWWWTEEMSETCRVLFQNKCEKLVHLVGFIVKVYFVGSYCIIISQCTVQNKIRRTACLIVKHTLKNMTKISISDVWVFVLQFLDTTA